jgi:hypothetical protein
VGGFAVATDTASGIEQALAKTQADVDVVLKAAASVNSAVKRLRAATQVGNLREMEPAMVAAEQAIAALRQQFANAKDGWAFDEEAYFATGSFVKELLETAEQLNVRIYEQDDRLYCYPSLVRVLPSDRAVEIDRKRERRIRPTVLVEQLRSLQKRPPRFRPEPFLEALYDAYETIPTRRGRAQEDPFADGRVVPLLEVYRRLTLLPGQTREYSRQEFARDIYLLDQSGIARTRDGAEMSFMVGTGSKTPANTIRIVTQEGREKLYQGISFTRPR